MKSRFYCPYTITAINVCKMMNSTISIIFRN